MFRTLISDRRVWLLGLLSALVWVLGRHVVPISWALTAVVKGGYWCMLAVFCAWVWSLWRLGGRDGWRLPSGLREWGVVALVIAGGALWQAHETHGYKILADESLLVGTSQTLHFDRDVGYPVRATDVQGPFQILQSVLDKRPYFFPFLVSLAHDLTGYRVENAFWFNTVLGFVFLGLVYGLCARVGGSMRAGVLALLLVIGLPLLAQQSAGAGFELLNGALILAWWWLAMRFLRAPDDDAQDAFLFTAVLLASTRYESLLFLVPAALILFLAWWRGGEVRCTALTWVAPLTVLPMLWLNRAFSANDRLWQLESLGAKEPFGLEYLPGNLGHALKYFFTLDGYQPNAPFLALLGLLALPLFLLWAQRVWRAPAQSAGEDAGLALGALGPLGITAVLMVYFWGQFDHPVITRLSIPTQLLLVVGVVAAGGRVLKIGPRVWNGLIVGAVVVVFAYEVPVMAKNAYGRDYGPGVAYAWRREFLARQPATDFLMLDQDSCMWISEKICATPILQARERRDGIAYHLRNRSFSSVFVYQTFEVNPDTGELTLPPEDELGPDFVLEKIAERRTQQLRIGRFSRVVAIKDGKPGGAELARAEPTANVIKDDASQRETDEAKKVYFDRWVRELP